ncbi:unnamed protein product [Gongylonema pulchrum]|uniref:glucuronosyltransferase n=1 Tax=Gongylonema pulchrum TaxID=637853 RepID=A0A183E458_9BILA|nr:unnamed protein product [Gongylonema pulchrum]
MILQIKHRAELFFINTDPVLEYSTALPPHVIPVGGLHIDDAKPLFHPWNETIEAATKGNIIVSLGNLANPAGMKPKQARSMLKALSRLSDYHIYWSVGPKLRLSDINEKDVPKHISLMAYVPQNDLLAQKRTRLLITNGGISSILEALTHGVPIVGIPLFGANKHNLNKVVHKGFGVLVEKHQLTEETLFSAIKEILNNPWYEKRAKSIKKLWQHSKRTRLADAIRWIEYVAGKHASKLSKSMVPNRSLVHLTNIDVFGISVLLLIFPLFFSYTAFLVIHFKRLQCGKK